MRVRIPSPVSCALSLLGAAGHEVFLVGGCVRDFLRGAVPSDFDLATSATPEEMLSVFSNYRTVETGIKHGTVTVIIDGMSIEITTYRVDGTYTDRRRPDSVAFTSSLREDLARRDFTVNAMAYHPECGVVDPFRGQEDLSLGILRAVGEPRARFSEDALRILRALRFAARLGYRLEEDTAASVHELSPLLADIARERVREELFKLFVGQYAEEVLREYRDVFLGILPGLCVPDFFSRLPQALIPRLAALLGEMGEESARSALLWLRTDNSTLRETCDLIRLNCEPILPDMPGLCRLLREYGEVTLGRSLAMRGARGEDTDSTRAMIQEILSSGRCYLPSMLKLSGKDLLNLGVPHGPMVGNLLEELYVAVIEERVENERESLLAFAAKAIKKQKQCKQNLS